ncbi:HD domain-containing protein (plasmid) [Adhaeribacter swui]|uniref:HD domain-containing protein n=1 Tax=Adhaeribacter swui TaxID=2086471 RepID=A0A7G7G225_9BACT|nr:HD domain-containing protein [Adhaeribacter swui]QNF31209.1 HD domain-containing protein [Adhaeribacter swui]
MLVTPLLNEAQLYVLNLLRNQQMESLVFHNYAHTLQVVQAAFDLAIHQNIAAVRQETLLLAAWFHDTGYCITYQGHEAESQKIAASFLQKRHYREEQVETVLHCINATKVTQAPQNLLEEIIRDADLFHLSAPGYDTALQNLRQEWQLYLGKSASDYDWLIENLSFLNKHQYHTIYAKEHWQAGKLKNIEWLENSIFHLLG